ncbi:MAG TPA: hypothetical protein VFA11_10325 [Acidimicrobiales bacterium]|nr:hypothetical protein [Acidimicrobiales bacterium]
MRTLFAVAAALAVAALGGAILGEYTLGGLVPLGAGALYGVVVAEVLVWVGRRPPAWAMGVAAAAAAVGAAWSLWISTGHHLSYASGAQWAAVGVAGLAVGGWAGTAEWAAERSARSARERRR